MSQAAGAAEAYNNLQGLIWDGSPYIDPTTGLPTSFVDNGDPVTGIGWLASYESHPGDTYWLMSSGPFELAPNDTQTVVIALVVGQGENPIKSISWMRYYDRIIQNYYDNLFLKPEEIPAPKITFSELDESIFLTWDRESITYQSCGYKFEGYNVYEGETEQGPWHKIAVFDEKNYITVVRDFCFCQELGYFTEIEVANGEDSGIQQYMDITNDWQGKLLVNGRQYYYAVTAYAYNSVGSPRILETEKQPVTITPHKPELKTAYNTTKEQEIAVTANAGTAETLGDISAEVIVKNPSAITGYDYQVDFLFAEEGPESGYATAFSITDITTNTVVVDKWENITDVNDYFPVFDGLLCKVVIPAPGAYGINVNAGTYGTYGAPYGGFTANPSVNRWITGVDWGGLTFWGGMDIGANFFGSTGITPKDYVDVTLHFVNDQSKWQKAYVYEKPGYAFKGVGTFPGWAEDVSNPANPRQINLCFVEQVDSQAPDMHWDPIAADVGDGLGGREYLFIMASDYAESGAYDDDNWGPGADVLYAMWACQRGSRNSDLEFDFTIHAIHPVRQGNNITFSTRGHEPTSSNEIARKKLDDINVFPNPYCAYNAAEKSSYHHFVTFINLPEDNCIIRIFSLSGQLVKAISHDNGTVFEQWDLCNDSHPKIPVASGMYIAHIEVPKVGVRILKLGVIMPQQSYIIYE